MITELTSSGKTIGFDWSLLQLIASISYANVV